MLHISLMYVLNLDYNLCMHICQHIFLMNIFRRTTVKNIFLYSCVYIYIFFLSLIFIIKFMVAKSPFAPFAECLILCFSVFTVLLFVVVHTCWLGTGIKTTWVGSAKVFKIWVQVSKLHPLSYIWTGGTRVCFFSSQQFGFDFRITGFWSTGISE